jgi:hypothetical protein
MKICLTHRKLLSDGKTYNNIFFYRRHQKKKKLQRGKLFHRENFIGKITNKHFIKQFLALNSKLPRGSLKLWGGLIFFLFTRGNANQTCFVVVLVASMHGFNS